MESNKVYELFGKIKEKWQKSVYAGKFAGKKYWVLNIECENNPDVKSLSVFDDKIGLVGKDGAEKIMKDIEEVNYHGKSYCFFASKKDNRYSLLGWKEL